MLQIYRLIKQALRRIIEWILLLSLSSLSTISLLKVSWSSLINLMADFDMLIFCSNLEYPKQNKK
jgi:hypothetical protein